MKKVIGFLVSVFALFLYSYFLLKIWGINLISEENTSNLVRSVTLSVGAAIVFVLIYGFFFLNPRKGYSNKNKVVNKKQ